MWDVNTRFVILAETTTMFTWLFYCVKFFYTFAPIKLFVSGWHYAPCKVIMRVYVLFKNVRAKKLDMSPPWQPKSGNRQGWWRLRIFLKWDPLFFKEPVCVRRIQLKDSNTPPSKNRISLRCPAGPLVSTCCSCLWMLPSTSWHCRLHLWSLFRSLLCGGNDSRGGNVSSRAS